MMAMMDAKKRERKAHHEEMMAGLERLNAWRRRNQFQKRQRP
jgi:hypothetical protein